MFNFSGVVLVVFYQILIGDLRRFGIIYLIFLALFGQCKFSECGHNIRDLRDARARYAPWQCHTHLDICAQKALFCHNYYQHMNRPTRLRSVSVLRFCCPSTCVRV